MSPSSAGACGSALASAPGTHRLLGSGTRVVFVVAGLFRTHTGFLHAETPPAPSFRGLPQSPHSITPFTTGLGLFMPEIIGSTGTRPEQPQISLRPGQRVQRQSRDAVSGTQSKLFRQSVKLTPFAQYELSSYGDGSDKLSPMDVSYTSQGSVWQRL